MEPHYYIRLRGKVLGPFTLTQLRSLRDQRKLSPFHEVSEDRISWVAASSMPDLFGTPAGVQTAIQVSESDPPAGPGPRGAAGGAAWYYLDEQAKSQGPCTAREVAALYDSGSIAPDTRVWHDGMPEWIALADCDELARMVRPRSRSSEQRSDSHWSSLRTGLTTLLVATFLVLGNGLLTAFGTLVAWLGDSSGGLVFTLFISGLLAVIAILVEAAGYGLCARVPTSCGARGYGITTLVLALVNLAFALVPFLGALYLVFLDTEPLGVRLRAGVAVRVVNLLVAFLLYLNVAAKNFVHLLFLKTVSQYLRDSSLAGLVGHTILAYFTTVTGSVLSWIDLLLLVVASGSALANARDMPRDVLMLGIALALLGALAVLAWIAWTVLYLIVLFRLRALTCRRGNP